MNTKLTLFDPVKKQLGEVVKTCTAIEVSTDETKEQALDLGKKVTKIEKNITATYKKVTQEARDFVKTAKEYEKSLLKQSEPAKAHLRSQLLKYEQKLKKEREEMERKLAEEKRKAEEEAKALAAKDVTPSAPSWDSIDNDTRVAQAEIDRQVELDAQKAQKEREFKRKQKEIEATKVKGTTKVWKHEIVNPLEVPREFLEIDHNAIRNWMKDKDLTTATIAGVRFYQEERMSFR